MADNPYEPPTNAEPEPDAATPIVSRTILGKLATPTFALLGLDFAWIAYDQLHQQKYLRVLHAIGLIFLFGHMAWRCRIAYRRESRR